MSNHESEEYGQTRMERAQEGEVVVEGDQPPPEYRQVHGTAEADIAHVGQTYAAVVTAHFPNAESADQALERLGALKLTGHDPIQRFEKEPPESKYDVNDPGLEPGEVAIIVQLADEAQGDEGVRICEEAGANHARFFPKQRIGDVVPKDK